jgi:hypothetical protein
MRTGARAVCQGVDTFCRHAHADRRGQRLRGDATHRTSGQGPLYLHLSR